MISSQTGSQQGDSIGPLLFSNTIHPLIVSLKSDLNLGYLDDESLGGPVDTVATDVGRIVEVGRAMGLHLNISKCELITHRDQTISDTLLQSFTRVDIADASLLGAHCFMCTQKSILSITTK